MQQQILLLSLWLVSLLSVPCASFTSCPTKCSFPSPPTTKTAGETTHLFASSPTTSQVDDLLSQLQKEAKEVGECAQILGEAIFKSDAEVKAEDIVQICDALDALKEQSSENDNGDTSTLVSSRLQLRKLALQTKRYEWLVKLMKADYDAYIATASFVSPSRIPRMELPNLQDVPMDNTLLTKVEKVDAADATAATATATTAAASSSQLNDENTGLPLVADCELDNMEYQESLLDKILLSIFRKLVVQNTGGVTSEKESILGLVEQARTYMLQPGQTAEAQHKMVKDTLAGLMTPVLPPFYRIFMSGIVPKDLGTDYDGKQFGPWFYAPFLTSFVTPTFFGFLVGPSHVNRRKDGRLGGLVVEKCKFLQESGCKGLCLHQCKLPAQEFFKDELGLPLTVQPNFETQECQWSFGELPVPPKEDPYFPSGCLVGCESRKQIAANGGNADACN